MLKVLIVDDEPFIREGLKILIDWSKEGYEVAAEAQNAFEAMEILAKDPFDLIMIDIRMPKMNGIELSKYIREKVSKKVSIIFLTGYLELDYVNEAFNVNAEQYLQKPIDPERLLETIRNIKNQIGMNREEENMKNRYARDLRDYYMVELLHGSQKEETIRYLNMIYRGEKNLNYVHLVFSTKEKEKMDDRAVYEEVAVLKTKLQRNLRDKSYCIINHTSSHTEYALGMIITGSMLVNQKVSIFELVDQILEELPLMTRLQTIAYIGKCVNDITHLNDSYKDALKNIPYMCNSKEVPLEIRLNSYIQAHYMENITLKSLSETFFINAAYLGQFFKKHNGVLLKDYLNSIRIKKAAEFLTNSNLKIYQIAENVGFQTVDVFIATFAKQMKVTPQKYRQEHKVKE